MQRKATKKTRGPNSAEKEFQHWLKNLPCVVCGRPGPSICDHMYGSTFRHNKILIGHWACLPYCQKCDSVKTIKGRKAHNVTFGITQAGLFKLWHNFYGYPIPEEVVNAIIDWGR